jgi:spoIIIJ-associated protein
MKVTEKWGDSVEAAVKLACQELDADPGEVKIEVLEEPSRGFFGIGSKLALVRVSVEEAGEEKAYKKVENIENIEVIEKEDEDIDWEEDAEETEESYSDEEITLDNEDKGYPEDLPLKKKNKKHKKKRNKSENRSFRSDNKPTRPEEKRQVANRDYDKLVKESELIMPVADPENLDTLDESEAKDFLQGVMDRMDISMDVEAKSDGKVTYLYLVGDDAGTVIGKRGITLDALQYLTGLAVNKSEEDYNRIILDAENYRAKRERSLEKLALRLADKVVRNGKSFRLEPMNPYERKVIHTILQKDDRVETRSEGQDPYRRVVIDLKK